MEQADLTLVVVDSTHLPSDVRQAAAFLQEHLRSVLPSQDQPEKGIKSWLQLQLHFKGTSGGNFY